MTSSVSSVDPPARAPEGDVYLHDALLYFDRDRLQMADNRGYPIEPHDALLVEAVMRGVMDFGHLCGEIARLTAEGDEGRVAATLTAVLRHPRSVLQLRPRVPIEPPDAIVCDFSPAPGLIDSRAVVRRLRRRLRVLYLGLEDRVRGSSGGVSFEGSRTAGQHGSWYEFVQWCRGTVRRYAGAPLVLTGPQDAVLFGDLAGDTPTAVMLDPDWPPRARLAGAFSADWSDQAPFRAVRSLVYALRFSSHRDVGDLTRAIGSDLALLEEHALRTAELVAFGGMDQAEELAQSTRAGRFVFGDGRRFLSSRRRGPGRRILAVVAGNEEPKAVVPALHLALSLTGDDLSFDEVALLQPDTWRQVERVPQGVRVTPLEGPPPHASDLVAALLIPGLLRRPEPAWECLRSGVPCLVIPSSRPHPVQEVVPPERILHPATAATLADALNKLRGAGRGRSSRKSLLAGRSASDVVTGWVLERSLRSRGEDAR